MPFRDVISWITMILGYSRSKDDYEKGLEIFKLMRMRGEAYPNEFTLDSVLRAIGRLKNLNEGKIVHGLSMVLGLESDHSVTGALIELYCNCDAIADAKKVYESIIDLCLNSSNALIGGINMIGRMEEAEMICNNMKEMNMVSYNLRIIGYAMSGRFEDSKRLFREMPDRSIFTSNTMISVYCRNGELDEALKLFERTKSERNTVTWNSMISGYILNDQPDKAIMLYMTMQRLPVERNSSTFSSLFHACSCFGSLLQGKLVHGHVVKTPFETDVHVGHPF